MPKQFSTLGELIPRVKRARAEHAKQPQWVPAYCTFPDKNAQETLRCLFPNLLVHRTNISNRPTATDPLALRPALSMEWYATMEGFVATATVNGEQSPVLEPAALQAWLCVEYPDTFKVAPT